MNKQNLQLIPHLETVINALENGNIYYDWRKPECCNCGLVAQSILAIDAKELGSVYKPLTGSVPHQEEDTSPTWQKASSYYCSVTGLSTNDVFKTLIEAGLTSTEIAHLEYLSDPMILERAGIEKGVIRTKMEDKKVEKTIRKTKWLFFTIEKKVTVTEQVERRIWHYQDRKSLLKYLQAWRDILVDKNVAIDENLSEELAETGVTTTSVN